MKEACELEPTKVVMTVTDAVPDLALDTRLLSDADDAGCVPESIEVDEPPGL